MKKLNLLKPNELPTEAFSYFLKRILLFAVMLIVTIIVAISTHLYLDMLLVALCILGYGIMSFKTYYDVSKGKYQYFMCECVRIDKKHKNAILTDLENGLNYEVVLSEKMENLEVGDKVNLMANIDNTYTEDDTIHFTDVMSISIIDYKKNKKQE